jgi:pseudaminic acid biosynthesis-associated methylase
MTSGEFTDQENFWKGAFGDDYVERNSGDKIIASNLSLFAEALNCVEHPNSILEFGANIGLNLRALRFLFPQATLKGIEINAQAASRLREFIGHENVIEGSILRVTQPSPVDLVLVKGVLIHVHPDQLSDVYKRIFDSSRRLILICEYFNPTPVAIPYRGHEEKLFKRDFVGEIMDLYPSLCLINYGFRYNRDPSFPLDDVNWFLLEKRRDR